MTERILSALSRTERKIDLEEEETSSIRYIILLEDTKAGRVARLAFPSQELYSRYLEKKDIKPKEARCSYVELDGEPGDGMHAFYCQWQDEGPWEVSGFSLDGTRPNFPMVPHDVRSTLIPIVTLELLSSDSFSERSAGHVSRVSRQLARPIQALDFDLLGELRSIPKSYHLFALLVVLSVITFFVNRSDPPEFVEGITRAPWLNSNLTNISYFKGDGRIVFEGDMEPRAVNRLFRGLEVIQPGDEFVVSRYTLYRDAGQQEELDRGSYWTQEGFDAWRRNHYAVVKYGYGAELRNGSKLAYDFVTNRLYGNLHDPSELSEFTAATPTGP